MRFIRLSNYIINIKDIIFADKDANNLITVRIQKGDKIQAITVQYKDEYAAKKAIDALSMEVDAITDDYWRSDFIRQLFFMREHVRDIHLEMEEIKKEFKNLRLELRRNRLTEEKNESSAH